MTSETIDERAAFDAWAVKHGRVVGYNGWRNDFEVWQARALLAAPEAPRQEPEAWKITYADNGELHRVSLSSEQADRLSTDSYYKVTPLYAAPLSPDHSGGAGVVLPSDKEIRELKIKAAWQADLTSGASYYTAAEFAADAMIDKVKELNQ